MDPQLRKLVDGVTPKMNPRIASGFVMDEVDKAKEYIHSILLSAQSDFPDGLHYVGMSKVSPEKEYEYRTYDKSYVISRSSIYAVELKFEYYGEKLKPQYISLPYLEEGGTLLLNGSRFTVTPVMIDKAYSVGTDNIFLNVNRTKLTFTQVLHSYYENDERKSSFIVCGDIYKGRDPSRNKGSKVRLEDMRETRAMSTILVHYLLAKEGVHGMFKKYFGIDVEMGDASTINTKNYDKSKYTICRSIGVKPALHKAKTYSPSDIRLVIKNEDLNIVSRSLIAGVFYVIDFYPERVKPEYLEGNKLWYILLALTLKPDVEQEGICIDKLDDHFRSLNTFIDTRVRRTLAESGVIVNDIFDVMVDLVKTYSDRINISTDELSTLYGKRLVILRYLLAGIQKSIFVLGFDLQSLKNSKKPFGKQEIEKIMEKRLKSPLIMKVASNPEVNSIANPTDNMVPTMTLAVKQQTSMAKHRNNGAGPTFTPALALSASIAEVGNLTSDAKDDYTGRSRLNPYLMVDDDGTILRNPDLQEIIEKTQREIRRD